jgi:hypothetical protein
VHIVGSNFADGLHEVVRPIEINAEKTSHSREGAIAVLDAPSVEVPTVADDRLNLTTLTHQERYAVGDILFHDE